MEKEEKNFNDFSEEKNMRKNSIFNISSFLPFSIAFYGLLAIFLGVFFPKLFAFGENNKIFLIVGGIMSVVGLFMIMSKYLQSTPRDLDRKSSYDEKVSFEVKDAIEKLESRTYQLQKELTTRIENLLNIVDEKNSRPIDFGFSVEQKKEVLDKASLNISQNLTTDFFSQLEQTIKSEIIEDRREIMFSLGRNYDNSIVRLKKEITLLTNRANLNLIIGSIITVVALFLLGYFVVNEDFNSSDILKVTLHFIPRLSLVVFIELFSFFFLKLYRSSLGEIKYYQNELTNIELKQIGLLSATNFGTKEDISIVIQELACEERNFKLQKGESTVDLEKTKIETQNLKEILKTSIEAITKNNSLFNK